MSLVTSVISQAAGAIMDLHPEMGGSYAYDLVERELQRNGILDKLDYKLAGGATEQTLKHIRRVQGLMAEVSNRLIQRAIVHDASKLEEPERSAFDDNTQALKGLEYGSQEYREQLSKLGPALKHHYENNSHHPEFHAAGIDGMSLLDLIEMIVDWKAAGERHATGSMAKSIEVNKDRFGMSDQLVNVFRNTANEMGWNVGGSQTC